ncbi:14165_t:CDS:2, partial [Gigaspora rosea]
GRKLDETTVSRMQIHMKFNVPVTQCDNGEIKHKAAAMPVNQQLQHVKSKSKIIPISDSETEATSKRAVAIHEKEIDIQKK